MAAPSRFPSPPVHGSSHFPTVKSSNEITFHTAATSGDTAPSADWREQRSLCNVHPVTAVAASLALRLM